MCLMNFICYPRCGHTEFIFPETGHCDFGFDTEKQSCSKGANELVSVDLGKTVPSVCPPCYETELASIRAEYIEYYAEIVENAAERGVGPDEVKGELDEIMKEMMMTAMEWKKTCELKGTLFLSPSSCPNPFESNL